jgi:hypothetical protein
MLAIRLAAKTPDNRKDLEYASLPACLKPLDKQRRQYLELYNPPSLYNNCRSFLLTFLQPC